MFAEAFHSIVMGIHLALEVKTSFGNSMPVTGFSTGSSTQKPGFPTDSHDTRKPKGHHEWQPFMTQSKSRGRVLPHPSVVFHVYASMDTPWVARHYPV
jgi:hypothetical protein